MTARSRAPLPLARAEDRYQVERKLGEGAAGAVYLVRDRETGEQLALKKLFRMDPKSVLRLKREFRSLQALRHPHIVKLYDMGQAEDAWFLTMEYLDGHDLTTYVNGNHARVSRGVDATDSVATLACTAEKFGPRVLPTFRQLARGIKALHDAGMLHRDLKPNNVLVVEQRVVVLDFGLVRELDASAATLTEAGVAAGTPAYMAPEQIMAKPLTAASDWYAFGVMLYEAISGLLPFEGPVMQLLNAKLTSEPVALDSVDSSAPRWLRELCMALLRREPAERPNGADVLASFDNAQPTAALTATNTENLLQTEMQGQPLTRELVGRASESRRLWDALAQAELGSSVVVHVRAPSGTGKSALVEHFLDQVEKPSVSSGRRDTLVLRSRCYELEAMPFKALDGVMDALMRHLAHLDDIDIAHRLPTDIASLAQVFPVLERLRPVKRLIATSRPTHDAVQNRSRAEAALRHLLDNLAARAPLVIWIDDLQWGDLDSARILRHWLEQPAASPILFVFSYRDDEVKTSSCLQKLLHEDPEHPMSGAAHHVELAALGPADVRALCERQLTEDIPSRAALIERVVCEAQGSPFFASQLIALAAAKSARGDGDLLQLSLDVMVAQTSAMLADDAKKLLSVLAVAGRPMSSKLLLEAAAVRRGGRALVHELRGLNLVRTREIAGQRRVEICHDRIRERVRDGLSADESRIIHENLFAALEAGGEAEPDWLYTLALGAGPTHTALALQYGEAAAARATESLAFERAASLYRRCVALTAAEDAGAIWSKLALALARSGRGVEAAEASLEAAQHVPASERAAWLERAAAHFLRCGHFEQGEALVRRVLAAKAIEVPTGRAGFVAAIVWERTRVKLRGQRDALRAGDYPAELLERCDLLASLALCTLSYDPLRAALFQVRALGCALEAGEPTRLVRTLSSAAYGAALDGSERAARESAALLARAEAISAKLTAPDTKNILSVGALRAYMLGRYKEVLEPATEVERLFRADAQDDPIGNYYTRLAVAAARLGTLLQFAQFAELDAQLRVLLEQATAHDNRTALLQLTYVQTRVEQVRGRSSETRPRLDAQRAELPPASFGLVHVLHMCGLMSSACWEADYHAVREHVQAAWSKFLHSPLRRAAAFAFIGHTEHARFVLNQYVMEGRHGDPKALVLADVQALERSAQYEPAANSIRARVSWLRGDVVQACTRLRAGLAAYEAVGWAHDAARDQYALGVLLGDAEGSALRAAAQLRIRELGVVDARADLRAYFPELAEPR